MGAEMTPAEEMREAARILREALEGTSLHNWTTGTACGPRGTWMDARWIVLLQPAIGEPLAVWLESAADDAELVGPDRRALALARHVTTQWQAMREAGDG